MSKRPGCGGRALQRAHRVPWVPRGRVQPGCRRCGDDRRGHGAAGGRRSRRARPAGGSARAGGVLRGGECQGGHRARQETVEIRTPAGACGKKPNLSGRPFSRRPALSRRNPDSLDFSSPPSHAPRTPATINAGGQRCLSLPLYAAAPGGGGFVWLISNADARPSRRRNAAAKRGFVHALPPEPRIGRDNRGSVQRGRLAGPCAAGRAGSVWSLTCR